MDRQHQGMDREREILEGMVEDERGRERPRATWTDNIKAWTGKGRYWREWWRMKEAGKDQEPHGQTTSRHGQGKGDIGGNGGG